MKDNWTKVDDKLPDKTGWYLVYAPTYDGWKSTNLANHDGVMFSKFTLTKAGKSSWSVNNSGYGGEGCVKYWMEIKPPEEATKKEQKEAKPCFCDLCGNKACLFNSLPYISMCSDYIELEGASEND